MKIYNLEGKRFGHWTVLQRSNRKQNGKILWDCKCDCGNIRQVTTGNLNSGNSLSCGCYARKEFIEKTTKHHMTKTRLHRIWVGMRKRCLSPKSPAYHNYGGRGITICNEWIKDFLNFFNWAMQSGYKDNLSIDRINNNGNYEPNNCRWVTKTVQDNNKRTCHYITMCGETHSLSDWCRKLSINERMVNMRIQRGWDEEKALTTPKTSYQ